MNKLDFIQVGESSYGTPQYIFNYAHVAETKSKALGICKKLGNVKSYRFDEAIVLATHDLKNFIDNINERSDRYEHTK